MSLLPDPISPSRPNRPTPTAGDMYRHDYVGWRTWTIATGASSAVGLLIAMALPQTTDHDAFVYLVAAGACAIGALIGLLVPRVPSPWPVVVTIVLSLGIVSGIIATADHTAGFFLFYFWPMLTGAMLLPEVLSLGLSILAVVLMGAALAVRPAGFDLVTWAQGGLVLVAVMLAVRTLRRGRDRVIADLERVASTDALTGLLNRGTFELSAGRMLTRARVDQQPLALVVFDIDHFKRLNDARGHAAGDAALRGFAATLREHTRPVDRIARIGGEEFVAVMPGATAEQAGRFAERVGAALREQNEQAGTLITVSAGVATAAPDDDVDRLLIEADRALYAAKGAGRDRVVLAEPVTAAR